MTCINLFPDKVCIRTRLARCALTPLDGQPADGSKGHSSCPLLSHQHRNRCTKHFDCGPGSFLAMIVMCRKCVFMLFPITGLDSKGLGQYKGHQSTSHDPNLFLVCKAAHMTLHHSVSYWEDTIEGSLSCFISRRGIRHGATVSEIGCQRISPSFCYCARKDPQADSSQVEQKASFNEKLISIE